MNEPDVLRTDCTTCKNFVPVSPLNSGEWGTMMIYACVGRKGDVCEYVPKENKDDGLC